ncbi:hypothetical protein HK405_002554, partial [Cladochytrium tenue]
SRPTLRSPSSGSRRSRSPSSASCCLTLTRPFFRRCSAASSKDAPASLPCTTRSETARAPRLLRSGVATSATLTTTSRPRSSTTSAWLESSRSTRPFCSRRQ